MELSHARKAHKSNNRRAQKLLRCVDAFKEPVTSFQLRGKGSHTTVLGSLCSVMILSLMAFYAYQKLDRLINRHNPAISTIAIENELGPSEVLNFRDAGLRVAFEFKQMHAN